MIAGIVKGDNGSGVFQGQNIVVMVLKSLYQALGTFTAMFHITPIQLGIGIAVIVFILLVIQIVQGIRGRTSFTLEKQEGQGA